MNEAERRGCLGQQWKRECYMRVLVVENDRVTLLGQVGIALEEAGAEIDICRPHAGDALPADAAAMARTLRAYASGEPAAAEGVVSGSSPTKIAFVFASIRGSKLFGSR